MRKLAPNLHQAFQIGIVIKGLDGILEIIGGVLVLFISPAAINSLAHTLTAHELSQDPDDFIARHFLHTAGTLTHGAAIYASVYLLAHGLTKLILVIALFKQKIWAYKWLIGVMAVFVIYQVYRIALRGSWGLTFLTVFDLIVIWLTWHEYQFKLAKT